MITIRKSPCNKCRKPVCEEFYCEPWRAWFLEAWGKLNKAAQQDVTLHQKAQESKILVALPHEGDPCEHCVRREWCDTACRERLLWWDRSMAKLRKRL